MISTPPIAVPLSVQPALSTITQHMQTNPKQSTPVDTVYFGEVFKPKTKLAPVIGTGQVSYPADILKFRIEIPVRRIAQVSPNQAEELKALREYSPTELEAARRRVVSVLGQQSAVIKQSLQQLHLPETVEVEETEILEPAEMTHEGKTRPIGWQGRKTFTFTTQNRNTKELTNLAQRLAGFAKEFSFTSFSEAAYDISNRKQAENEAFQKAVEDGRKKAKIFAHEAQDLGFEVDTIPEITINQPSFKNQNTPQVTLSSEVTLGYPLKIAKFLPKNAKPELRTPEVQALLQRRDIEKPSWLSTQASTIWRKLTGPKLASPEQKQSPGQEQKQD